MIRTFQKGINKILWHYQTCPQSFSPRLSFDAGNCLIGQNIANASEATWTKMAVMASENLRADLGGQPMPHCVKPEMFES